MEANSLLEILDKCDAVCLPCEEASASYELMAYNILIHYTSDGADHKTGDQLAVALSAEVLLNMLEREAQRHVKKFKAST